MALIRRPQGCAIYLANLAQSLGQMGGKRRAGRGVGFFSSRLRATGHAGAGGISGAAAISFQQIMGRVLQGHGGNGWLAAERPPGLFLNR